MFQTLEGIKMRVQYWLSLSHIKSFVKKMMRIDDSPQKIARGFAIGVFWGVLPTFGLAIVFSLPTAVLLRANKIASILGTFVSNPLTTPFVYAFSYKIGQWVLGHSSSAFSWKFINIEELLNISKSLLIGSVIFSLILSLVTYLLVLMIVSNYRRRKHSKAGIPGEKSSRK
ncbi:hypothetical protein DRZ78_01345 [Candidatus Aerophobetes bacterium]|uniref:DUF2062 domain-containing protein n=1 Tax=Aerophobetes bacterium TaxID=2030807 RepID=A0A662D640_UNCAE|nr:MAG: hypothetical protein DRZ78_01345 [Candidatus Aerophobetes bacterium]